MDENSEARDNTSETLTGFKSLNWEFHLYKYIVLPQSH